MCHLFFNKSNEKTYNYLYSLGPLMSNRIAFGPLSESEIKNIQLAYIRDLDLDFLKSKYSTKNINISVDNDITNKIFKINDKYRF